MILIETHKYDDIIHLPHPVSPNRAGIPEADRAAQFSPFAALTGYDDVIAESGRLTQEAPELTQTSKDSINETLLQLSQCCRERPGVTVTYFKPDLRKAGGSCVTVHGYVKKADPCEQMLILTDGTKIPMEQILCLQAE